MASRQDYARVTPQFWTGTTGRALRGHPHAQVAAAYLITCRSATPIGVFHLALPTMQHETGLSAAKLRSALELLEREGFAYYDEHREEVWVPERARTQIAPELERNDNRWRFVQAWLKEVDSSPFAESFRRKYAISYHLELPEDEKQEETGKGSSTPFEGVEEGADTPREPVSVAVAGAPTVSVAVAGAPAREKTTEGETTPRPQVSSRRRDSFLDAAWKTCDELEVERPSAGLLKRWLRWYEGDEAWFLRAWDALGVHGFLTKGTGYLAKALQGIAERGDHKGTVEIRHEAAATPRYEVGQRSRDGALTFDGEQWVDSAEYAARQEPVEAVS